MEVQSYSPQKIKRAFSAFQVILLIRYSEFTIFSRHRRRLRRLRVRPAPLNMVGKVKKTTEGKPTTCWGKFGDFLYDVTTLSLSIMDVVTDLLIANQFYQNDQMVFFWICISIFIIASISYSVLFITIFASSWEDSSKFALFICLLPFSQLVPIIIWVFSFEFDWTLDLCRYMGFRDMDMSIYSDNKDPMKLYMLRKLQSHGGFLCESAVEAVPQSILQMIAIVMTNEVTVVNVVSIGLSISSVASKAFMVCYSIHGPTFFFNFLSAVADIVNIFVIVSWVFLEPLPGTSVYDNPLNSADIYTTIWVYKELAVAGALAFFGQLFFISFAVQKVVEDWHTAERWETFRRVIGTLEIIGAIRV